MKKKTKIILSVLLVFVLVLAVIAGLNFKKVALLIDVFTNRYTQQDIEKLEEESFGVLKGVADGENEVEFNKLTDEEKTALEEGKITEEEAREIVLGKKKYVDGKVVDLSEKNVPVDKSAEIISEIYVLEATYTGKLAAVEHNMLVAYNNLPTDQKTTTNKYKLANNAINEGLALEKECDGKLEALLQKLEANLKECNKDTSVINEIRTTYKNKKSAMQVYYMRKYS